MSNVQIMDHPLIKHKISYIRQENVGSRDSGQSWERLRH